MMPGDPQAPKNGGEGATPHVELHYKTLTLERGKGYRVVLVFLEMPGTQHRGLSIERGGVTLAKGVIAKTVRGLELPNVESAMPPPPDSNAILQVRLTEPNDQETLDRIVESVRTFLKSQGFESPEAPV
jgi:hypothetical protein